MTSIEIPEGITSIGDYAFMGSALKTVYGTLGLYAETFAKKNGYWFVEQGVTVPTVTNVKAAVAGKNKVKVTWDKVSGATGYIVYVRKNGKYAKLDVTAATNYTDTKALDNDYNFYWVFPYHYDKNGNRVIGPICGCVYGKAK